MPNVVPIYSKEEAKGTITYQLDEESLKTSNGFFSFAYYNHAKTTGQSWKAKGSSIYIWGLTLYSQMLGQGPFANWKMIIYTDSYTYENLKGIPKEEYDYERIQNLLNNPNIVFALVEWEEQYRRPDVKQMNGGALRAFRSRAPFDFPNKYVFIRDADTFWEENVKRLQLRGRFSSNAAYESYIARLAETFLEWETNFFSVLNELVSRMRKPLLVVGTGDMGFGQNYKKPYHDNELTDLVLPYGVFAGFINVTPGVPVFQTMKAWDTFIEYVNERSVRGEMKKNNENQYYLFSNNGKPQAMGRDEQLYLYILMKTSIDNLFIYKIGLGDLTIPKLETINMDYHTAKLNGYKRAVGLLPPEANSAPVQKEANSAPQSNWLVSAPAPRWGRGGKKTYRKKRKSKRTRKN